jgi:hypothetical protein
LTSPIIGVSETFFPLRSSPPKDPSSRLLVLGLISNHFFYVNLKPGAPIYQRRQKREDNIVPMKLWNGSILLWIDKHILKRRSTLREQLF